MESNPRVNVKEFIIDVETFIEGVGDDKLRIMLMELDMYSQDYERPVAIAYLSGNCAHNKHLANIVLNGMYDDEVKEMMEMARGKLNSEIERRKA